MILRCSCPRSSSAFSSPQPTPPQSTLVHQSKRVISCPSDCMPRTRSFCISLHCTPTGRLFSVRQQYVSDARKKLCAYSFSNLLPSTYGQSKPKLLEGLPPCRPLSRLQDFLCVSLSSHANRVASRSFTALAACSTQAIIHTDTLQLLKFHGIIPSSYTYVLVQYKQVPQTAWRISTVCDQIRLVGAATSSSASSCTPIISYRSSWPSAPTPQM